MSTVLITAFEPYDRWPANASWLALVELTKQLPRQPAVTTRLYPVDLAALRESLSNDLASNFDYALHLGQAPGTARLRLEAIGINVAGHRSGPADEPARLVDQGPVAYRSELPLAAWAEKLRGHGIPAEVSYHAGTFLCNAALYYSHHFVQQRKLKTRCTLIHLPLDVSQACGEPSDVASLPAEVSAQGIRLILEELRGG